MPLLIISIPATLSAPVDSVLSWPMGAKFDLLWSINGHDTIKVLNLFPQFGLALAFQCVSAMRRVCSWELQPPSACFQNKCIWSRFTFWNQIQSTHSLKQVYPDEFSLNKLNYLAIMSNYYSLLLYQ